jgi:rubrerythrin
MNFRSQSSSQDAFNSVAEHARPNKALSRRRLLFAGAAAAGSASALVLPTFTEVAQAQGGQGDLKILNNALFYEHQAIWAYGFAAGKLSGGDVGKAVLAIALRNQADHKKHRDLLASVISRMGGTPVREQASYDVSSYIQKGEGNLDSDVNIAKLALALEVDAAIAYTQEISRLKTPALIVAGASIGENEAAHATTIRAAFKSLGVPLEIVPAAFVNTDNRSTWIVRV